MNPRIHRPGKTSARFLERQWVATDGKRRRGSMESVVVTPCPGGVRSPHLRGSWKNLPGFSSARFGADTTSWTVLGNTPRTIRSTSAAWNKWGPGLR